MKAAAVPLIILAALVAIFYWFFWRQVGSGASAATRLIGYV